MPNKKWNVVLGSIVLALIASASVQAADQAKPKATETTAGSADKSAASAADREMMSKLAQANMGEVALAELAKTKSTDEKVLKFADTMIEDHTKAQNDLADIAGEADVQLPTQTDAKHVETLKKMQTMDAAAFDSAYKKQAVKDHSAAQALLKKISANAKNADFKALGKKLTPAINQHMKMAKAMQST